MEYDLSIENTPDTIPSGTGVLLLHPSTGETDRIDTDFLKTDTDKFLIISTRTTAREVEQKLEYYEVDYDKAVILDTLSVERGYSRRSSENVFYLSSPDDLNGIISRTEDFLQNYGGKRRISVDSITELSYFAGEAETYEAVVKLLELLDRYDAVGLFHLADEVHNEKTLDRYRELFPGVVTLRPDGTISGQFDR